MGHFSHLYSLNGLNYRANKSCKKDDKGQCCIIDDEIDDCGCERLGDDFTALAVINTDLRNFFLGTLIS
jgi:hypothetical protein